MVKAVHKKNIYQNLSNLADELIQSDLQEQLGLSVLFRGTLTDCSTSQLMVLNQLPLGYWPKRS
jgi:hypothetical protein